MDEKKSNIYLKAAIAILALCLCGLGFYTFQFYHENKSDRTLLAQEKASLKTELRTLLSKFEQAKTENDQLKADFSKAEQKIERLLDSVENMEATYVFMRKYKHQISLMKREKERLFQKIDRLSTKNEILQNQVDSTKSQLAKTEKRSDSLSAQNEKLTEKISKAAQPKIVQLEAKGVFLKNNGTTKSTDRAGRAEKIEVCFKLAENELTPSGKKQLFVQIINPKNNLLGEKSSISFGEAVLVYSKKVEFVYENQARTLCNLVPAQKENLPKGSYLVNVFFGDELLASDRFELE